MPAPHPPRTAPGADVDLALWGRNVAFARHLRGMTQAGLAALVGAYLAHTYDQKRVSEWENGHRRPTDPQRIALAAVLEVSAFALFPYPNPNGHAPHGN